MTIGRATMRRLLTACALAMFAASPSFSQEVVIKMGNFLSDPKPGHTPHHMMSIQDYSVKGISFHTKGEVELDILDRDEARVPVTGTSQGDFDFVPMWLGGELVANNNVVSAASLPPFIYETRELMVTAIPSGVEIQEGDVVLIRTGREAREASVGSWDVRKAGAAGPHPEIVTLLHERGVALLGGDVADEIHPSLVADVRSPMHLLAIVSMGMPLFDNLGLEALAQEAGARERWTFLFVAAPLSIEHATGSAVNPLASTPRRAAPSK